MADFDIVARASGQKPGDQRWTVLTITHQEGSFVAEIVGETLVEGEQRRVRVEEFNSVLAALAWGAFNQKSALYDELRRKATDWLETRVFGDVKGRIPTMAPGKRTQSMGFISDFDGLRDVELVPPATPWLKPGMFVKGFVREREGILEIVNPEPADAVIVPGQRASVEVFNRACELLRELMEAANSADDDRMDRAIYAASDFLDGIDNARR